MRPETNRPETPGQISRPLLRRTLRDWTIEGCTATVQITLTQGAFQTGYALFIGCSHFVIGVLAAIPAFAGLLQLVSSYLAQRYRRRKLLVAWFSLASRLLWLPILAIPFVVPRHLWVDVFLILTLLSSALSNVSSPLWTAWITDLVPADNRGRYFGQRNMYAGFVGMVASVLGGFFLDTASRLHLYSQATAFAIVFIVSCVFAFPSVFIAFRSPDPAESRSRAEQDGGGATRNVWKYYAAPFADRRFLRIMIFLASVAVSQTFAAQFFIVYQLEYLKFSYTALQLLAALASLASLVSMPIMGYLADKYGNRPILMLSLVLVVITPFLYIPAVPDGIAGLWAARHGAISISSAKIYIGVMNVIAGVGWAGVGLTQFNLMIGAAPAAQRTVYVSAVAGLSGLAGGIAPLLGGEILQRLFLVHIPTIGPIFNAYHVLFLMTMVLRVSCLLLLRPIVEQGSKSARYVLGQLKATKPIGSVANIQKLAHGNSAQARQHAAEGLAKLKTPVAVEELVKALDDVALPVREHAARALGEIGDRRALTPLLSKLSDPVSGIDGAAAEALGKIGDVAALPALAAAAQLGPVPRRLAAVAALANLDGRQATIVLLDLVSDPPLKMPVLRALGEREDAASATALIAILREERDPPALAIIADALGRLGDPQAGPVLIEALRATSSPRVRNEILNAVGSVLGGRDSFYPYLALDSFARDETVGKILLNIQRRVRARTARGLPSQYSRIAVRAKQALEAYAQGNSSVALNRLAKIVDFVPSPPDESVKDRALRSTLHAMSGDGHQAEPVSAEEVLLAVFLIRGLLDR